MLTIVTILTILEIVIFLVIPMPDRNKIATAIVFTTIILSIVAIYNLFGL